MNTIEKHFKEKTSNLTFIELKENSFVELKGYIIKDELPLPILTEGLIKGIREGFYQEEISIGEIIQGVIYTIGTDADFPYIEEYKEILYAYDENIVDYIFYTSIKDLEKGEIDDGCIKLRALLVLEPRNTNAIFNYGLGIEALAKIYIEDDKPKGQIFLDFSTNLFESILDIDEDYALVHYKLGYHYLYSEQYNYFIRRVVIFVTFIKGEEII